MGTHRITPPKFAMVVKMKSKNDAVIPYVAGPPAAAYDVDDRDVLSREQTKGFVHDGVESKPSGRSPPDIDTLNTRKQNLKIGTWNVRSLFMKGKLQNVIQEAESMHVDIMGICETRWTGVGDVNVNGWRFVYSGGESHHHGVGLLLHESVGKCVKGFWPVSDRVLVLKVAAKPFDLCIIQTYAPTAESSEEAIDNFYHDLDLAYRQVKSTDVLFLMGDFNAKVGSAICDDDVIGSYGLGEVNERGERLKDFCEMHDLLITNTFFKNPPRRLYTWMSPGDIARNQIDYVIVNRRFRNAVLNAKAYPGADCNSDHNPVIATVRLKLKKIPRSTPSSLRLDVAALRQDEIRQKFAVEISNKFHILDGEVENECVQEESQSSSVDDMFKELKSTILTTCEEVLPKRQRNVKNDWMTDDILHLMQERKAAKHRNTVLYNKLDHQIRSKCNEAKEQWMQGQCEIIEEMQANHQYAAMHKKIKDVTGNVNRRKANCIKNKKGDVLFEVEDILERWSEYIRELYGDNDRAKDKPDIRCPMEGPSLLKDEILYALSSLKSGKAAGPDEISVDMLKALDEKGFSAIYETGNIPSELTRSTVITLPKKANAVECKDHRTISLMSHVLKVLLKVIEQRIVKRIDDNLPEVQFGFRSGVGTRDAIVCFRNVYERCIEMQSDVYTCFIDFEKAFDRVQHDKMIDILQEIGLDGKDIRVIRNVYWDQEAGIRMNERTSAWQKIERGVRQGCVLSPALFNLYSQYVLRCLDACPGVVVNHKLIYRHYWTQ